MVDCARREVTSFNTGASGKRVSLRILQYMYVGVNISLRTFPSLCSELHIVSLTLARLPTLKGISTRGAGTMHVTRKSWAYIGASPLAILKVNYFGANTGLSLDLEIWKKRAQIPR